jgi:hypothetical protein
MQKAIKALTLLRLQEYGDLAMVFPQGQDTCHGPMPFFGHADAA